MSTTQWVVINKALKEDMKRHVLDLHIVLGKERDAGDIEYQEKTYSLV